jgi:DNA topoisomerase-1
MALIIVESPNKIPKIRKALGNGYTVMASVGSIMDLEKKEMGINLDTFTPSYKVNHDKTDVVKALKAEAKNHKDIYIATDPDREGEGIAFSIKEILPKRGKNIQRISFKELTKAAIMGAIKNPVGFNDELYAAQQARRMTDRMVGFKVSPVMWNKGLKKTSAGRVQSATLKWLTEREKEIRAFVKEEYWTIIAETKDGFNANFYGIGKKKFVPKSKKEADEIVAAIKGDLEVTDYQAKTRKRSPSPPFITATLQQDASTRFGWTSKKVMDNAQELFSQGLITYHRTDSVRTEASKIIDIRDKIENKFGKNYLSTNKRLYKNKDAAQDAHEAIRPTFEAIPMTVSSEQRRLLDLITDRFMASQMADAIFDQSSIALEYKDKKSYVFKVSGSVQQFDGFLKAYGSASKDLVLPAMKKGQKVGVKKFVPGQHFTKAPPRYTDASFVGKMKKEGVGRPSSYATIPETLVRHGYIVRDGKSLKPTEIGIMVADYLSVYFKDLTDAQFTSTMESELDQIGSGSIKMFDFMDKFYNVLKSEITVARKGSSKQIFESEIECPSCNDGTKMSRKIGEHGVFLGCQSWPKCGHIINIKEDGSFEDGQVETGTPCPECGNPIVKRKGKYGEFWGCKAYPTCTWKGKLDENGNIIKRSSSGETTGIKCGVCKQGEMVKRKGKFGEFLGCNRYPDCKTIVNLDANGKPVVKKKKKAAKSTGKTCPKCKKNELVERDGKFGKFIACSGFPKCRHIEK